MQKDTIDKRFLYLRRYLTYKYILVMKKKSITLLVAASLASCITFSSCIGSFGLTNKLLSWNQGINSKFVNELVFIAFHIIPVYEITCLADILILNSIEFWSGDNPVADTGKTETIKTDDGVYTVETKSDGYHIEKEGDEKTELDLVYNKEDNSWSVKSGENAYQLLKYNNENEVVMYMPNGEEMNVELSQAGVLAFQEATQNYSFFAAR